MRRVVITVLTEALQQLAASGVGFLAGVGTGFLIWGRKAMMRNAK